MQQTARRLLPHLQPSHADRGGWSGRVTRALAGTPELHAAVAAELDEGRASAEQRARLEAARLMWGGPAPAIPGPDRLPQWFLDPWWIISPHPDDAAYSLGGSLALRRALGLPTVIDVVFGRSSHAVDGISGWSSYEITELRCREERWFSDHIGAHSRIGPLPDLLLRTPDARTRMHTGEPLDATLVAAVEARVRYGVARDGYWVLAPMAAGLMPDHALVAAAVCSTVPDGRLLVYEDLPYARFVEGRAKGLDMYADRGRRLAPVDVDVTSAFEEKMDNLTLYRSQLHPDVPGLIREAATRFAERGGPQYVERIWEVER